MIDLRRFRPAFGIVSGMGIGPVRLACPSRAQRRRTRLACWDSPLGRATAGRRGVVKLFEKGSVFDDSTMCRIEDLGATLGMALFFATAQRGSMFATWEMGRWYGTISVLQFASSSKGDSVPDRTVDESLTICETGAVWELMLNRPERRNALTSDLVAALAAAITQAPNRARTVIIYGQGSVFCAGVDLKERAKVDGFKARAYNRATSAMIDAVARCPIPVIAALNGPALGGGFELALAADIRIADPSARLASPEVSLGIMPGAGATQRLFRAVGGGWARAMLLSGHAIDADVALRIGLVQEISNAGRVLDAARAWARDIAKNAPLGVRAVKEIIVATEEAPLAQGLLLEREMIFRLFASEDRDEGLAAFTERRPPEFRGR